MTWTYDLDTEVGKVRLLITDINVTMVGEDAPGATFTDEEIKTFLALNGEEVRLAAAQALETIAADETLCSKYVKDHDVTVDGPKVAAELRAQAANLRAQHAAAVEDEGFVEIVEFGGW